MAVAVFWCSTLPLNVFKTLRGWGGQHTAKQLPSYPDFISRSTFNLENPSINKLGQKELRLRQMLSACESRDGRTGHKISLPALVVKFVFFKGKLYLSLILTHLMNKGGVTRLSKASPKMRRSQNSWCFCWRNSRLGVGGRRGSCGGLS